MPTIAEAVKQLGMTRDELHYRIKTGLIQPQKVGKRYLLTDEEVEKVRRSLQVKTKPSAAIIQIQVAGKQTRTAVDALKDHFPQVVWAAGAWGDCSVIALLEAPKFENIVSVPWALGEFDYVKNTKTSIIPSSQYHVREMPVIEYERLAVILINAEKAPRRAPRLVEDLADIPEVRRWGTLLGQWDAFAEVRYSDADRLFSIVMDTIYDIPSVINTTTVLTMSKLRREGTNSSNQHSQVTSG